MSIQGLREELKDIDGASAMTMRYDEGGKVEVYTIGEIEVRLPGGATAEDIRRTLQETDPE